MKLQLAVIFLVFLFFYQASSHTLYDIIECSKSKSCDGESQCQIDLKQKCTSDDDDSIIFENQDCKTVKQYESQQIGSIDVILRKPIYQTPDQMSALYAQYQIKDGKLAQALQKALSQYKNYYDQYQADKSNKDLQQKLSFRYITILQSFKQLFSSKIIGNNLYKAYQSCIKTCYSLLTNQEAKAFVALQLQCFREVKEESSNKESSNKESSNEESPNIASNIGILQFSCVLIQIILLFI